MIESKIQSKIKKALEDQGWTVIRPISISKSGYPDLFCFRSGRTLFIEVKRPGEKLRKLQEYRKRELEAQGFKVLVIDDPKQLKDYELI